jgi:hypothetical protein
MVLERKWFYKRLDGYKWQNRDSAARECAGEAPEPRRLRTQHVNRVLPLTLTLQQPSFQLRPTLLLSLTCPFCSRKIRASDRPNHLALPHHREAGRRWDGRGL